MITQSNAEAILARALSDMLKSWDQTAWVWRDRAREDFQKQYIEELKPPIKAAIKTMSAVSELLRKTIRECS